MSRRRVILRRAELFVLRFDHHLKNQHSVWRKASFLISCRKDLAPCLLMQYFTLHFFFFLSNSYLHFSRCSFCVSFPTPFVPSFICDDSETSLNFTVADGKKKSLPRQKERREHVAEVSPRELIVLFVSITRHPKCHRKCNANIYRTSFTRSTID